MINLVKNYSTIIIHRHTRPDLDALGSQIGLAEAIKETFPEKKVYVVGDENKYQFVGRMDDIDDSLYQDALSIITDVAVSHLVSDNRYLLAKEVLVIDHHNNESDINAHFIVDKSCSSASEIVCNLIKENGFKINQKGATALFGGIVTDTGRFFYPSISANTFNSAAYLINNGALVQDIYDHLYIEDLKTKKMKSYFANKFEITEHNVAYLMNDVEVFKMFDVDTFTVSRGMVNVMSGIDGINIWVNFTIDVENNKVLAEIRSRNIVTVDVAKKYGGGGHNMACGASLNNFEEAKLLLNDLDLLAKEYIDERNIREN